MLIREELAIVPHYKIHNHKIWGATAKMISELLYILKDDLF